jgi:hypothetical protein
MPEGHARTSWTAYDLSHLDALDECPSTSGVVPPRERVLKLIKGLFEARLPNLRICVTSRPEADILEALGPLASHTVSLHDEDGQKQDIVDYVTFVVHSDCNMRKWRLGDKKLVIDTISERANGMQVITITYFLIVLISVQVPMGFLSTRDTAWMLSPGASACS